MITLNDCCGRVQAFAPGSLDGKPFITTIIMVVKAPRGTMALFKSDDEDEQCEAVKVFMEQHRG